MVLEQLDIIPRIEQTEILPSSKRGAADIEARVASHWWSSWIPVGRPAIMDVDMNFKESNRGYTAPKFPSLLGERHI